MMSLFRQTKVSARSKICRNAQKPRRELAKKVGVDIKHLYLTSGDSDLVIFVDAPSGDNVAIGTKRTYQSR